MLVILTAANINDIRELTLFPSGYIINAFILRFESVDAMTYSDLIEHEAGETEIRSYLVDGDVVPVTMRIPANLRDSAKEAASLRGMSFSAFVRTCMINELAKGGK